MKRQKMLGVSAIFCHKCRDLLYSRFTHDYRTCECGNVMIDGGRDYTRCGGEEANTFTLLRIQIPKLPDQEKSGRWPY